MASTVHVVLQEDVDNLGASGEVVRVRPGYARNFLIPRGLAVPATRANLAHIDELKRKASARVASQRGDAEQLKVKLEAISIRVERVVGDDEKMYGSVTARDIQEAFRAAGAEVDRKKIALDAPLREIGTFEVVAKLYKDVVATLKVEVAKATEKTEADGPTSKSGKGGKSGKTDKAKKPAKAAKGAAKG